MNTEIFIANVAERCKSLNTSPTAACIASGAGKNLISNMKKGEKTSYKRLEKLATYLGCSISDLTGETKEPATVSDGELNRNEVRIVGRDGTYVQRQLTDEQMKALKLMLEQLPEADDL